MYVHVYYNSKEITIIPAQERIKKVGVACDFTHMTQVRKLLHLYIYNGRSFWSKAYNYNYSTQDIVICSLYV